MKHVLSVVVMGLTLFGVAAEWDSYELVNRREPAPVPGLENADFEDSKEYGPWKGGLTAEVGRFGFNGGGGVRYWPKHDTRTFRFPFKGKLVSGRTYRFSCLYRRNGNMWASIMWTRYRDGKYLHEYSGGTREDVGAGWVRNEIVFTPPANDGEAGVEDTLGLWIRPDEKDPAKWQAADYYIDMDSVRITEAVPEWRFCNVWPIQNRVYRETGRVRCHNQFVGDFFKKDAEPFFIVRLNAADGTRRIERTCRAEENVFTVDFGALPFEGEAELSVSLYDRRNRLGYGEKKVAVTVLPTPTPARGKPFITENGTTLVDGKPFMPLGFWTGLADDCLTNKAHFVRRLGELQDAGFNAIVEYGGYRLQTKEDRDFFYGQCEKHGIHVFAGELGLGLWDEYKARPDRAAAYREKAAFYQKYPAVFAWFVTDECAADRVPDLVQMRRNLTAVAPDVPMWPCNIFEPEPFLPGQDVQGGDLYPYYNPDSTLAGADRALAAFEACRPAACWHSPQCYNWFGRGQGMTPECYLKGEPDENQMLAVAVLMASRSVSGFLFYSHFFLWCPCAVPGLSEVRWTRMKGIARTMNALAPFITSGIRREEVPHRDLGDPCRVVKLSDGKGAFRILIIGLGNRHECEIDIAGLGGSAAVPSAGPKSRCGLTTFVGGKAVFSGGSVSCDIIE